VADSTGVSGVDTVKSSTAQQPSRRSLPPAGTTYVKAALNGGRSRQVVARPHLPMTSSWGNPVEAILRGPGCAPGGLVCADTPYENGRVDPEPPVGFALTPNEFLVDDCTLTGFSRFACSVTVVVGGFAGGGEEYDLNLKMWSGDFFPTCPDDPASIEIYSATKTATRDNPPGSVTFNISPTVLLPDFVWVGVMSTQDTDGDIFWSTGSNAETGSTEGTTAQDDDVVQVNGDGICTPAGDYIGIVNGANQENIAGMQIRINANQGTPGFCCDRETATCSPNVLYQDCRGPLDVWSQNVDCTGNCTLCVDPHSLGGVPEGEVDCSPGYVDLTNSGCGGNNTFTPITCGAAAARLGTSGTYAPSCGTDTDCPPGETCNAGLCTGLGGERDSDWYQLTLTQDSVITISVVSRFPTRIELHNNGGIAANCLGPIFPIAIATGIACETINLSDSLDAGVWNFRIAPQPLTGIPCGSKYRVQVDCAAADLSALKGACCGDGVAGAASCTSLTQRTCLGRRGLFFGVGTTCGVEGLDCPGTPLNDECIAPQLIPSAFSTSIDFRTNFANNSGGGAGNVLVQPLCQQDPANPIDMKHDVFFRFQIPTIGFPGSPGTTITSGDLVISTMGSTYDTWVTVYGGTGVNCAANICLEQEIATGGCSDDASVYPGVVNDNPLSYLVIPCDGQNGTPLPGDCVGIRVGGKENAALAQALGQPFEPSDFDRGACVLNVDFIPRTPNPFGTGSSVGKCCQPDGSCAVLVGDGISSAEQLCLAGGGKYRIFTDFQEGGTDTSGNPQPIPEPFPASPGCATYPCPPVGSACFNALPLNLLAGDPLFGVDFGSVTRLVRDQAYFRYKVPTTPPAAIVFDTCDSNFDSVLSIYSDDNNTTGECLDSGNLIAANDECNPADQWYFLFPSQIPPLGNAIGATKRASCFGGAAATNDACVCLPTTDAMSADSEVIICIGRFPTMPMRPTFTRPSIAPVRNPLLASLTAVLNITAAPEGCFVCDAVCPAGPPTPVQEGGPICTDNPAPPCPSLFVCNDPFNGGCSNSGIPPAFGSPILPCSSVDTMVCGKTGAFRSFIACTNDEVCRGTETCSAGLCTGQRANYVDEDWYKVQISEPVRLSWRVVHSEAPARLLVLEDDGLDCNNVDVLGEAIASVGCTPPNGVPSTPEVVVDLCGRPVSQGGPTTYYLVIMSAISTGPSCNSDYVAALRCDPYPGRQDCCKADMNNDAKVNGLDIKKWVESFLFPAVQFDEFNGCASINTCRADITNDGEIGMDDILPFVNQLVVTAKPTCPPLPDQCSDPARCQPTGNLPSDALLADALERSDLDTTVDDRAAECICPTVSGSINELCWWGVYATGFLGDCGPEEDCFTITFYNNVPNQKCPGTLLLAPQTVTVTRTDTGEDFGGLPEFNYRATLPTPLSVTANNCVWVEIVNKTQASSCFWYWEASGTGDTRHARHDQNPPVGTIPPGGTTWTCTDGPDPDPNPDDRRELDLSICASVRINKNGCGKPVGQCCYRTATFPGGSIVCENLTEEMCLEVKHGLWDENLTCSTPCVTGRCCDLPNGLGQPVRCTAPALAGECAAVNGVFAVGANCGGAPPCPTGRCCDYSPVNCVIESEVECQTRGGIWDGTIATCTTPNTCPPSICNAFVGPNPPRRCFTPATTNASAVTSDIDDDFFQADDFTVSTTGTIRQLCWRGIHQVPGTANDCGENLTETFRVTYYHDAQFSIAPDTNQVMNTVLGQPAIFNVTPARIAEGSLSASAIYKYEIFHTAIPVTSGSCYWVEIINTTPTPDCRWFWHTSGQGNPKHAFRFVGVDPNAGFAFDTDSLTMCLGPATLIYAPTACPITAPPPLNDTCIQGQQSTYSLVTNVPTQGTTVGAIDDAPLVLCGASGTGPDVYYNWTAPASGATTFKLCPTPPNPPGASQYDAIIGVHTGCAATAANKLGCDDDGCGAMAGPSILTLPGIVASTTYVVRVNGWGGGIGNFFVVVTQP
jgi:hypothetical protein